MEYDLSCPTPSPIDLSRGTQPSYAQAPTPSQASIPRTASVPSATTITRSTLLGSARVYAAQLVTRIERPDGTFKELDPERAVQLYRYRQKRALRLKAYAEGHRTIRYECRKVLADGRPRVRGRFCKADCDVAASAVAEVDDGKADGGKPIVDSEDAGSGGVIGTDGMDAEVECEASSLRRALSAVHLQARVAVTGAGNQ